MRFHTLNRKTGHRIVSQYVDSVTGKPVKEEDEAKGYARDESTFVLLEDEDLEAVKLESARTIDIESFVPADSVDWIWYHTPDDLIARRPCTAKRLIASSGTRCAPARRSDCRVSSTAESARCC